MLRLKDRNKQIPGGLFWHEASTNLRIPSNPGSMSLDVIVQNLIAHRQGNPHNTSKNGLATDVATVTREVEHFNATVCHRMGWNQFIEGVDGGTPPPPKSQTPHQQSQINAAAAKASKIWAGVKTLNDWLDSGEPAVDAALSESRAKVCAACPKNGQGDMTKWFTAPASEVIRRQLGVVSERKLSTSQDAKLNICEVCLCPMKLKVHTPRTFIEAHLTTEVMAELRMAPGCWIPKEMGHA